MDELVKIAKNGDINAFSKLINNIEVELYNIAKMKLNNYEDVNDVIQETIIDIYRDIPKIKNDKLFRTWSVRILMNNCNDVLKKKYKNQNVISFEDYINTKNDISTTSNLEKINSNMNFENIIKVLTEKEKSVFILYYSEDYTTKEISKILRTNENTIKSILKRGKEKLKNNFAEVSTNDE